MPTLMRTKKFETRLQLNSNFENHDIELKKQLKMKKHLIKTRKEKSLNTDYDSTTVFQSLRNFAVEIVNVGAPSILALNPNYTYVQNTKRYRMNISALNEQHFQFL